MTRRGSLVALNVSIFTEAARPRRARRSAFFSSRRWRRSSRWNCSLFRSELARPARRLVGVCRQAHWLCQTTAANRLRRIVPLRGESCSGSWRRRCSIVIRSRERREDVATRRPSPATPGPPRRTRFRPLAPTSIIVSSRFVAHVLEPVLDGLAVEPGFLERPGDRHLELGVLEDLERTGIFLRGGTMANRATRSRFWSKSTDALDADRRDVPQRDDQPLLIDLPAQDPDRDRVAKHQERPALLAEDAEDLVGQRAGHELDRVEEDVAVDPGLDLRDPAPSGNERVVQGQRDPALDARRLVEHGGGERQDPVRDLVVDDRVEQPRASVPGAARSGPACPE